MNKLTTLLPAQSLLVLEGKQASFKELLKLTFIDLLLKQVLELRTVEQQPHPNDPVRYYKYISAGKNFNSYRPVDHEYIYLAAFKESDSIEILFQNLIRMGVENAQNAKMYRLSISQSPNLQRYCSQNFVQSIIDSFSITDLGRQLRADLQSEITALERDFPVLIENQPEKAKQWVNELGGAVFLLKNIDVSVLARIDSDILAELNKQYQDNDNGIACFGCSVWDSSSADSGCSDGSGCSGCGGD